MPGFLDVDLATVDDLVPVRACPGADLRLPASGWRHHLVDVVSPGRDPLLAQGIDLPVEVLFRGQDPHVPRYTWAPVSKVRFARAQWDVVLGLVLEREYMACRGPRWVP